MDPILALIQRGNPDAIRWWFREYPETVNDLIGNGTMSNLHLAAEVGRGEIIEVLLGLGCAHLDTALNGTTPFHLAVESGNLNCVQTLLRHGIESISTVDGNGYRPIHLAVLSFCPSIVECLLLLTPSEVDAYTEDGHTPLQMAIKFQRWNMLPVLLRFGASVDLSVISPENHSEEAKYAYSLLQAFSLKSSLTEETVLMYRFNVYFESSLLSRLLLTIF